LPGFGVAWLRRQIPCGVGRSAAWRSHPGYRVGWSWSNR